MVAQGLIVIFTILFATCSFASNLDGLSEFAASRHLLATTDADADDSRATIYENNCSMLYSRGVNISFVSNGKTGELYPLPGTNSTSVTQKGSCTDGVPGYSFLKVDYKKLPGAVSEFSVFITFNSTASGAWSMTEMSITLKCASNTNKDNCTSFTDTKMDVSFIKSYLGFSYHCYQPPQVTGANSTIILSFNKLQVQGFGVKKAAGDSHGKFSAADDCIGFFTGGVWSSLFVTLILTIILLYGIGMISSINSMDRFDDPRGPGIQINVAE